MVRSDVQMPSDTTGSRNLYEEEVGWFWEFSSSRYYCQMRAQHAQNLETLSGNYQVAPLLEMAVSHYLHVLHVDIPDHLELSVQLPFTLLKLNQDERCAAFITHCMRRRKHEICEHMESLHANSAVGDWIYGTTDCYADIFDALGVENLEAVLAPYLVALCIVKLRIIARHKEQCQQVESFRATSCAQQLGDNVMHIERFVEGDTAHKARICEQEQQVDRYLDLASVVDPPLLSQILNPDVIERKDVFHGFVMGFDMHSWLVSCKSLFEGVAGGLELLQRRVEARQV
ncbi:hypothetical protein FGB62_130g013 [Gracilaria domingensis]|nr:hypothetical protein FGB62_130g013 [Gracilaria domingensis]